jgi:hypothetical protein
MSLFKQLSFISLEMQRMVNVANAKNTNVYEVHGLGRVAAKKSGRLLFQDATNDRQYCY